MTDRRIGPKGLALIKRYEGLELKAYKDVVGVLTIGYGSTGPHVKTGMIITEAEAEALLRKDLSRFEDGVEKLAGDMSAGQFSALVSFAFNLGLGKLQKSTLLKKHLAGDFTDAASEFVKWNKAGGQVLKGLTNRRKAEAELYKL